MPNIKFTENQSIITDKEIVKKKLLHQFTKCFIKFWQDFMNTQNCIAEWNPSGFRNPRF